MQYPDGWTEEEELAFKQAIESRGVDYAKVNALFPLYDYRRAFREQRDAAPRPVPTQNALLRHFTPELAELIRTKDMPLIGTRQNGLNLKYLRDGDIGTKALGLFFDGQW